MKVRMLAVVSIFTLAAWLPIQAQQPTAPSAPAAQAQTPATPSEKGQPAAKHSCCCEQEKQAGQEAASAKTDHPAMECCHGKSKDGAKASCCEGKDAKAMECCSKAEKDCKTAMNCCQGATEAICAAKSGQSCCNGLDGKNGKGCAGMAGHRAGHASG